MTTQAKSSGTVFFWTMYPDNTIPAPLVKRMLAEAQTAIAALPDDLVREQAISYHERVCAEKLDDLLHAFRRDTDPFANDKNMDACFDFLTLQSNPEFNIIAFSIMSNHVHLCVSTNRGDAVGAMLDFQRRCTEFLSQSVHINIGWNELLVSNTLPDRKALAERMHFIIQEPVAREIELKPFDWRATFVREKYRNLLSQL